jgi:type IX secretion system PorP/SprF family membrane protein
MKNLILSFSVSLLAIAALAQTGHPLHLQLATPATEFTALSGWHGGVQASANYQNNFPNSIGQTTGYLLNIDAYSEKAHSAFGATLSNNGSNDGKLNTNKIEGYYSPKFKLKNDLLLMPSLSVSYNQNYLDWDQLTDTNANGGYGFVYSTGQTPISNVKQYIGLAAGGALAYHEWFAAANLSYLNRPNTSFFANSKSLIPIRGSFIIGKNFQLNEVILTPTIGYATQANFKTLRASVNAQYKGFVLAGNILWGDMIGAAVGYNYKNKLRLSYAYNRQYSSLGTGTWVSHEVSLNVWLFNKNNDRGFLKNMGIM